MRIEAGLHAALTALLEQEPIAESNMETFYCLYCDADREDGGKEGIPHRPDCAWDAARRAWLLWQEAHGRLGPCE